MEVNMAEHIDVKTRFYRLFPSTGYLGYGYEDYAAEYGRSAFLVIDVYGLGFHPDDPVPAYSQDGHAAAERPALAWLESSAHEDRIIKIKNNLFRKCPNYHHLFSSKQNPIIIKYVCPFQIRNKLSSKKFDPSQRCRGNISCKIHLCLDTFLI